MTLSNPITLSRLSIHSFLIRELYEKLRAEALTFNSFVSDTVSLGFILCWCYLFVLVLGENVFVQGLPMGCINFSLVFILLPVNDMDWEEGLGKNLFYKKSTSRKALKLPVENVSTEISKGTISSHPVSRWKNLCFSFFSILSNK